MAGDHPLHRRRGLPADTGLIYTTVTAHISYAMARNDNAPKKLGEVTARGVPLASVALAFVIGLIVFLPFPGWQKLVGFITSATVLSFGSGPLVLSALRRALPAQDRPFRLPGGDVLPFLAFWSANQIVFWAGWDVNWKLSSPCCSASYSWPCRLSPERDSRVRSSSAPAGGCCHGSDCLRWCPTWVRFLRTAMQMVRRPYFRSAGTSWPSLR